MPSQAAVETPRHTERLWLPPAVLAAREEARKRSLLLQRLHVRLKNAGKEQKAPSVCRQSIRRPQPASTSWRIKILSAYGQSYFGLAEVEFATPATGMGSALNEL